MATRYYEDFQVGDLIDLGTISASKEEIIAFARQYDPQPFHIDAELAKESAFGTLVASGWHTGSLFMRLLVDNLLNETISMGSPGVDELRWLRPLHPDEVLHGRLTVTACKESKSRPTMGIVNSYCEMINADGVVVMSLKAVHLFGRRR